MLIFSAVKSDASLRRRSVAGIVLFSHFVILITSHSVVNDSIGDDR